MLNYTYRKHKNIDTSTYVVPENFVTGNLQANQAFNNRQEFRLQSVYGDEIWTKLQRVGLSPAKIKNFAILDVCAGMGFVSYHILSRCYPNRLVLNDISTDELQVAKGLLQSKYSDYNPDWYLGDVNTIPLDKKYDLIIGNSFLHHFPDVPKVLAKFYSLLNPGGYFISLHEPTPMAVVVDGAKLGAYPLAILFPKLVVDIARRRYKGEPSATDIWMFTLNKLVDVAYKSGFSDVSFTAWNLLRSIVAYKNNLHLSATKPQLNIDEEHLLKKAINRDATLNKIIPARFFGSFCLAAQK